MKKGMGSYCLLDTKLCQGVKEKVLVIGNGYINVNVILPQDIFLNLINPSLLLTAIMMSNSGNICSSKDTLVICNGPRQTWGYRKHRQEINLQGQVFRKHTSKAFPLSTRSEINWFFIF